ncbi:MAG: DUF72 domain-containing protein [Acidimicrobiales bacterium]
MPVYVGTSGWQYPSWRGPFYPQGVPSRLWLEHYAAVFRTVEVNNTFYRLPRREVFDAWAARTPDDFVMTVKASRYLTHVRRLDAPQEPVQRLMAAASSLGTKLGVVLLQLPPDLPARIEALEETLACFPAGTRVAVEPRHESWFSADLRRLLERHDAALALADRRSRPVTPIWRTATWGYLRLHEGRGVAHPCYGRTALASWAARLASLFEDRDDVYVYFNNDPRACAVRDARRFAMSLGAVGLRPTRTSSSVRG